MCSSEEMVITINQRLISNLVTVTEENLSYVFKTIN